MSFRLLPKRPLYFYSFRRLLEFRHRFSTRVKLPFFENNKILRCNLYPNYLCHTTNMAYSMASSRKDEPNRLIHERSPYLLQHAHNPVDWYPWGTEAFNKAVMTNRLIFLSIGYSTCHWCHVMERESFENEKIAKMLNDNYVAIKLDREERPDLDKIYMSYVQRITGSGGWPLSVFLTPSLEPIYGGTYFPPEDAFNRIGFATLLHLIAAQWKDQHTILKREAKAAVEMVRAQVNKKITAQGSDILGSSCWEKCFGQLNNSYDGLYGGFSDAPKFPQSVLLNFLLTIYSRYKNSFIGQKSLEMVLFTLKKIACGGIHDHVGFGFARYSVDSRWHVPHFEKMLYDQSQLAMTYLDSYAISKEDNYVNIARMILTYIDRDLSHPAGGFYSAEDADSLPSTDASTKKEGAFYVWTMNEIRQLLVEERECDVFCYHFNVQDNGNVNPDKDPHNELIEQNVLFCDGSFTKTGAHFGLDVGEVETILRKCLNVLFDARSKRPRPSVDTKMVTGWNGLTIAAYAKAAFILNDESYKQRAIKAANFIRAHLTTANGSLLRCCYGNEDRIEQLTKPIQGLLDDYAYLIQGLIYLYECTFDGHWLQWAEELQALQDQKFWDSQNGAYWNSLADDPFAIIRSKEDQDGAEPCGNSVSALNLIRLAHYLDHEPYRQSAKKILLGYSRIMDALPIGLPAMLVALIHFQTTPHQIIIAGKRDEPDTQALLNVVREQFLPGRILIIADGPDGGSEVFYKRHKTLDNIRPVQGQAAAYVCKRFACTLPTTNPEALAQILAAKGKDPSQDGTSSSSTD